jgi:phospholipid/cholesterol/gamma-HCH transport system substrate-binding protein
MEKKNLEMLVGLFVVMGAVALVFLSLKAANLASFSFDSTYTLTARFDNVGGLKIRAPVKSAGVTVGRIRSIVFDDKVFQGVVTLQVDRRYQFPTDTSAKILTSGLLGDQYIGLDPGADDKSLQPGDAIKLTQSAVVLEDLIGKALYGKAAEGGNNRPKEAAK